MIRPVVEQEVASTAEKPRTPEEIEAYIARLDGASEIVAQSLRGPTNSTRDVRALRSGKSGDNPYPPGMDSTAMLRDARSGLDDDDADESQ